MKKITVTVFLLLFLFSFVSCNPSAKEDGYSFTDDLGRQVTVNRFERVACLLGSYADLWMLAGGEVCASADDAFEDLCLPLPADAVNLGSTHNPNAEALLMAAPDLVFASSKLAKHLEMKDQLEAIGIHVVYFDVADFDSYLRVLKIMTEITGNTERYTQYGTEQEKRIEKLIVKRQNEEKQTVLVLRASAQSIRAKNSENTMLGGMLRDFGCMNIADSNGALLENLSVESIVLQNPDKIFFIQTGDDMEAVKAAAEAMFDENPLWGQLDAVKNGKVYYMEKELFNMKPNARFSEAYEKLDRILYDEN
ncbi:MAG: ABC transporter substrate-binding protein [Clostridia bacterium]|nr:ABC transporter substrate-binding protein [Clostridia bacterium]